MKTAKNLNGYTLIELLVGITIVSIIFGVGISSYREFSRRQALTGVSKQLKADLRLAQQLALTGQKPDGVSCNTLNGYKFTRVNASTYRILADCAGVATPYLYKEVNLGSDVTLTSTNSTVTFKVLGQGTDLTAGNTLTLTHTSGNQNTMTIGIGGDVR